MFKKIKMWVGKKLEIANLYVDLGKLGAQKKIIEAKMVYVRLKIEKLKGGG